MTETEVWRLKVLFLTFEFRAFNIIVSSFDIRIFTF